MAKKKWSDLKKAMSKQAQARVEARVRQTLAAMPCATPRADGSAMA